MTNLWDCRNMTKNTTNLPLILQCNPANQGPTPILLPQFSFTAGDCEFGIAYRDEFSTAGLRDPILPLSLDPILSSHGFLAQHGHYHFFHSGSRDSPRLDASRASSRRSTSLSHCWMIFEQLPSPSTSRLHMRRNR